MISRDLNAPFYASIPSPHDAVHFANTKNATNSLHPSVAIRAKSIDLCIVRDATLPRGENLHTRTGERVSTPREKASWPVCFSLGHGLAWFTWTNQTRETPEPEHGGLGNPPIQDGRGSLQWKFANESPGIQEPQILNYLPYRQKRPRMPAARVQQLNDRNASKWSCPASNRWQQMATPKG